jgi:hypothetical protein
MVVKKIFAQRDALQAFRGDAHFPAGDFIKQKEAHASTVMMNVMRLAGQS